MIIDHETEPEPLTKLSPSPKASGSHPDGPAATTTVPSEPAPPAGMSGEKGPLFRLIKDQRIAFLLVGVTNTVVGTLWFVAFQFLVQQYIGYMGVLLCAHVAAVLCAFVLYRTFVFKVHGHVLRDLWRFELVNLTALAINAVLLPLLVELAHWPVLVSQLSIISVTMLVSFFGHRGFSFRRTSADHLKTAERAAARAGQEPTPSTATPSAPTPSTPRKA